MVLELEVGEVDQERKVHADINLIEETYETCIEEALVRFGSPFLDSVVLRCYLGKQGDQNSGNYLSHHKHENRAQVKDDVLAAIPDDIQGI